jgi:protein-tyrosine phosphatase
LTRDRVLVWDGCVNVRDLGGLPLEGGGETRFGVVVRADSIRGLTEHGWRALVDYDVGLAIDLRADEEVAEDGTEEPPVPVVRVPITPWAIPGLERDWPSMRLGYLAVLETFQPEFSRAVSAVAGASQTVVIHCAGGRDRTGLLVAVLLRLAGVDLETIAHDHAQSDENWAPFLDAWFEEAPDEEDRERRRRIAAPAGRTMVEVLEEVEARYGGPRGYLRGGGASDEELDRIVLRLAA